MTTAVTTTTTKSEKEPKRAAPNRVLFGNTQLRNWHKHGAQRQEVFWDTKETGLSVLRSRGAKGAKQSTVTFRVVYNLHGELRYFAIGRYPQKYPASDYADAIDCSDLEAVRDRARQIRINAKAGIDPKRRRLSGDFDQVVARFLSEHAATIKTGDETRRIFERYVLPEWGQRQTEDIKKSDVAELLNRIAEGKIKTKIGTPVIARATRIQLGVFFNWYVENYSSDDFRSPVVKSKKWKAPGGRERNLSNDELRALWQSAGSLGIYGALVKTALLTAQRFHKVSDMQRRDLHPVYDRQRDIRIEHAWDPTRKDDPENKKVAVVPLSNLCRQIIASVPMINPDHGQDFVFSVDGKRPMQNFTKPKRKLDAMMLDALRQQARDRGEDPSQVTLAPWQARDLRRTARTLLSMAGVDALIGERCLAHVIRGVAGTYDKFSYLPEKQDAFERLAAKIAEIVSLPPGGASVVTLARRGRPPRRKAA